jgi:hypothetical protein
VNACVSCGHELSDDARFCSQCGLPVGTREPGQDLLVSRDGRDDWLLTPRSLDRARTRSRTSSQLAIVVVAIVVGAIAFLLFRSPTASLEGVADELALPTTAVPTTTSTAPAPIEGSTEETVRDEEAESVDVPAISSEFDGLAGHYLMVGRSGELQRIDLDTGAVEAYSTPGDLIGHFEGSLYFVRGRQAVVSMPVDQLDEQPSPQLVYEMAGEGNDDQVFVSMSDQGRIDLSQFVFSDVAGMTWTLSHVDLDRGETFSGESNAQGFPFFGLVNVPGGRLFEVTGSGYRRLVDAAPVAYGARYVLVQTCDDPATCRYWWFDREASAEVDRPIPEDVNSDQGVIGLVIGDRVLVRFGPEGWRYYDIATGNYVLDGVVAPEIDGRMLMLAEAASPDGRYLSTVDRGGRTLVIYDLDQQARIDVPIDRPGQVLKTLFVPKAP